MGSKHLDFQKEELKYVNSAKEYLTPSHKTEGLLKKALKKAMVNKVSLGEAFGKLQLFLELAGAYTKGEYRNVSTSTILSVLGAIIYFISPLDVVPDFLVGIGILDDVAVIGFTLKKISGELDDFKLWQKNNSMMKSPQD
ncbi:hypothetical protein BTR25_00495 [Bacillus sp. MRMR6]|nr:hypothetical protein BTR25_00495 [Bacillus sp. MRMR6]